MTVEITAGLTVLGLLLGWWLARLSMRSLRRQLADMASARAFDADDAETAQENRWGKDQRINALEAQIGRMAAWRTEDGLNTLSLRTAGLIEDEFVEHHGGRDQRLAKVQLIVREAVREALAGERKWDAWAPGNFLALPTKPAEKV